jgi:glycosyltransferase involved in cell wall biosynthesis
MACALPVVAAIATGSLSLVTDGVTGRLVRPGAINAFAELLRYCRTEGAGRPAGLAGLEVSRRYGWDQ